MRAVRLQYFLAYAVTGSLWPFLSVYLAQQGLDKGQIGYTQAAASVAAVLSPVLVTLLADTRLDPRRVLSVLLLLSCAALTAFSKAQGFWPILLLWALQQLLFSPTVPLQDGVNFSIQQRRRESGLEPIPYHRVRVFGTIGFIVPGLILLVLLSPEGSPWRAVLPGFLATRGQPGLWMALATGAAFLLLAGLNTWRLPDPRSAIAPVPETRVKLPTLAAARAMLRPPLLVFCVGMFLVQMACAVYYTFYPVYLTERAGIGNQWLGLVMDLGVVVEIFFMLGFGWLMHRLGTKKLMLIGISCIGLRMALLAAVPGAAVAVGTQIFHGIMVLTITVAPAVFVNQHADDRFRHSMQGLYAMLILGVARIVGNLLAGPIAKWSLTGAYAWAAFLCVLAAVLILFSFHERRPEERAADGQQPATAAAKAG